MAFNETNAKEMEKVRHQDEGLAMDMRGLMADKICVTPQLAEVSCGRA